MICGRGEWEQMRCLLLPCTVLALVDGAVCCTVLSILRYGKNTSRLCVLCASEEIPGYRW